MFEQLRKALGKLRRWLNGDGEARDARHRQCEERKRTRQVNQLMLAIEGEARAGSIVRIEREMIDVTFEADDYHQYAPGSISIEVIRQDGTQLFNFGYELKVV